MDHVENGHWVYWLATARRSWKGKPAVRPSHRQRRNAMLPGRQAGKGHDCCIEEDKGGKDYAAESIHHVLAQPQIDQAPT